MNIFELKKRALHLIFVSVAIIGVTGCTISKIVPEPISADIHTSKIHIDTYSYKLDSFFNNEHLDKLLLASTNKILGNSIRTNAPTDPKENGDSYHLKIHVIQRSHGGASGADFLTGLSLGLIPSWRTDYGMYAFDYVLFKNGRQCSFSGFLVDETGYGHILLLPIGLVQMALGGYRDAQNFYEKSLKSAISTGCGNE